MLALLPRVSRSLLAPLSLAVGSFVTFGAGGRAQAAPSSSAPAAAAGTMEHAVVADLCPPAPATTAADTPTRKRCLGKRVTAFVQPDGTLRRAPFATPMGYGPSDLRAAYAMPAPGAATPIVGILVAYHYAGLESDLAAYRTQFGLPACSIASGCLTVAYADSNGQTNTVPPAQPAGSGWDVQEMSSTELVSAMCPECKLLVIESQSDMDDSLYAAVDVAVQLGARSVALTYGNTEDSTTPSLETHFNHPGVLIAAPTGDNGFQGQPAYPATSAYTLSVGGTTLQKTTGGRGWTEIAWSGTGSGCSAYIPKPAWQNDTGCTKRMTADVAAVADPNTGVAAYATSQNGWTVLGGTTDSAAIIAGAFAALGVADQAPSFPWEQSSAFYDVTSGNNDSSGCAPNSYECTAQTGYDGPTGWGTPNGAAIAPFGQSDAGAGDASTSEAGAHDAGASGPDAGGGMDASMAADGSSSGGGSDSGGPSGDDSGSGSGSDAGSQASAPSSSSGCGCSFANAPAGSGWLAMTVAFGLVLRRRKRDGRG